MSERKSSDCEAEKKGNIMRQRIESENKSFVIMGCGFLGEIVVSAYKKGLLKGYHLAGAYSRKAEDAKRILGGTDAQVCETLEELLALKPDYLVETASIALFKEAAIQALQQGTSVVPLSIGALADEDFKNAVIKAAQQTGAKVNIPSGAVGGFDVLQTVALMAQAGVTHDQPFGADGDSVSIEAGIHTHKGPKSLQNTPLFTEQLLTDEQESTVFTGTTKEAIALLPTKVNVAIASALASVGPDKATAQITSVPEFVGDDHCITAETDGIKAVVDIYSSTSAIAGWSVVALLRNLVSPIQFY